MIRKSLLPQKIRQSKYGQIEEEWVTTDAEGFFEHCMDRESRLSMLKNKINEVIDFLNKN
jgi:hypothetical protein